MTVAELAAADLQDIGYLLAVEGWPVLFTNRVELCGAGGDSWIGTAEGARTVALGLEPPASLRTSIEVLESGLIGEDSAAFTIVDRAGHVIAYLKDEAGSPVYQRLGPTDDPAPPSLVGGGGQTVDLFDRWIEGEAIGSAGERRLYQCIPGAPFAPRDHAPTTDDGQLAGAVVRTAARHLEGTLCALYVIRRDPATGTWASWGDQHASGASLIWFGRTRGWSVEGSTWRLDCDGPGSWLSKTVNASRPARWSQVTPLLDLSDAENRIAIAFNMMAFNGSQQVCGSSFYQVADTLTADDAEGLADEIDTRLLAIAAAAGPDATFDVYANGEVKLDTQALTLRVDDNGDAVAYGGLLYLRAHRRVWARLGWVPEVQARGWADLSTPLAVEVRESPPNATDPADQFLKGPDDPGEGYVELLFRTTPIGVNHVEQPSLADGNGAPRSYLPMFPGGAHALDAAGGRLSIGIGPSAYLEGQLARPPADVSIADVGAADATGFVAIRGRWLVAGADEPVDRVGLCKVSWKATTDGGVEVDGGARAILYLESWLDSRQWGAKYGALKGTWAESRFEFCPVALLSYRTDYPDAAHAVLARLLLSTGTAGPWSGFEGDQAATIAPGVNAHPDASGVDDDLEIADLGLGIPADLVDLKSIRAAAAALPGGAGGVLDRTRMALLGPADSLDLIEGLCAPRGWCLSLAGGKIGLFPRNQPLDVADSVASLGPSDVAGDADELPPGESVDLAPLVPFDLVELEHGRDQLGGDGESRTLRLRARDPRAVSRRGGARRQIDAWTLTEAAAGSQEIAELWSQQLAAFYSEPHARVTVKIKGNKSLQISPGSVVRYTSPWPASREGGYGMTARAARVLSVERDLGSLTATLELLVQAGDPTARRRFAPVARLLDDVATAEARHDPATRTLYCYADAWGRDGNTSDVAAFAEPAWLGVNGDALAYVWSSWDGVTWEKTAEFEVESVSTANDSITYKAGTLSPSDGVWERRLTLITLAPWEDQDASSWPRALFGVVAGHDGKFGAGNLDAFKWEQ